MALRLTSRFWPIHVSGGLLLVHAAVVVLFPNASNARSYVCLALAVLFAVAGSLRQMRGSGGALRLAWRFWIGMLLLRTTVLLYDGLLASGDAPSWLQFNSLWLGSGITAMSLLAICCTADEEAPLRTRLSDGVVALAVSLLIDANVLLPAIGLTGDTRFLSFVLLLSCFVAAVGAIAVFGTANTRVRRFHLLAVLFLGLQCVATLLANNVSYLLLHHHNADLVDLVSDLPGLLFGCVAFFKPIAEAKRLRRNKFSYLVQSTIPFVPGFAAFMLGARLVTEYPAWGICGMSVAVLGSGFRAIVVQSQYLARQENIETRNVELQELTEQDALTGVGNRRSFKKVMELEWNETLRSAKPFSLLIIDVDYLKVINDTYGHVRGDECLVKVSRILHIVSLQFGGHLARVGGDEFALILRATDMAKAISLGERACASVAELAFDVGAGRRMSLSIGVATLAGKDKEFPEPEAMVEAADRALYEAKGRGRGCVVGFAQDLVDADL